MGRKLTGTAQAIYTLVMVVAVVADLGVLLALFSGHNGGLAVAFLLFGSWIVPTLGHLIGMALAAPFAVAGAVMEHKRATPRIADEDRPIWNGLS